MKRRIFTCSVHGLLLVLIHIVYFNMDITMPLENEVMGAIGKTENHFGGTGQYEDSNFVFINTAYDNALLHGVNEQGDSINLVVADRSMLATLFESLADHGNRHRYILCDILFDLESPHDARMAKELSRVKKLIMPVHAKGKGETELVFGGKKALADYITYEGKISKIRLYARSNASKTLPMEMYEDYNGIDTKVHWTGLWNEKGFVPYSIYPRYYFTQENISKHEISLGKLVRLLQHDDSLFYDFFLRDKIIVIGNFHADRHITPLGQFMPGSLVLFNTFLTLQSEAHFENWFWLLGIFMLFFMLAYYELYFYSGLVPRSRWSSILHFAGLSGLCIAISVVSNFLFGIHTTILPVILYFEVLHFLRKVYKPKHAL